MGGKWFAKNNKIDFLTWEEEQIIIGSLLGDGYMEIRTNRETSRFTESHSMKQSEYLQWKVAGITRLGAVYSETIRQNYTVARLRTAFLPILRKYYDLFYRNRKKYLSEEVLGYIHHLALAVWFMDDGTLRKKKVNKARAIRLMTESFTYDENVKLSEFLKRRFDIGGHIEARCMTANRYGRKQTYYIELGTNATRRFANLIQPFIHPTMQYKLEGLQSMF